ncbi:MAG: hypothetical protein QOI81_476 [Actinomycetota bacterium]|jgi:hypothetical protein|nr:hypothetical protein [Actinomycetota bacterium]
MARDDQTYVVQIDLSPADPGRLQDLLVVIRTRWPNSAILFGVVRLYAESGGANPIAAALAANGDAVAMAEEADIPIGGDVRARIVEGSTSRPLFER